MLNTVLFALWPYVPQCVVIGGTLYVLSKLSGMGGFAKTEVTLYALGTPPVLIALAVQHDWILGGFVAGTGALACVDLPRLLEVSAVGLFALGLEPRRRDPTVGYWCFMLAHAAAGALMWRHGYWALFGSQLLSVCTDALLAWCAEGPSTDKK